MGSKVVKSPPCGTMLENFLGFFWGFLKVDLGYFDPWYLATLFAAGRYRGRSSVAIMTTEVSSQGTVRQQLQIYLIFPGFPAKCLQHSVKYFYHDHYKCVSG